MTAEPCQYYDRGPRSLARLRYVNTTAGFIIQPRRSSDTLLREQSGCSPVKSRAKPSRRRTLGPPALHFAVVKFLHDLPLVSCGAMAVRVQLDLPLGSPFAPRVARVFHQVVVIVLVVICLFERDQPLDVCRHLETECNRFSVRRASERVNKRRHPVFIYAQSRDRSGGSADRGYLLRIVAVNIAFLALFEFHNPFL